MSRSYKKPWVKDPANSYMKKIHARKMRRKVKQIVENYRKTVVYEWRTEFLFYYTDYLMYLPTEPQIPHYRSVTNQYDICDYIFPDSSPKGTRK